MASEASGHEGHGLGLVATLNTLIPAALSAASGYGIALLMWKRYTIDWYTHELEHSFEESFVVGDVVFGAASTAIINTLIVAAIVLWQWDRGDIRPTERDWLEIREPRTRVTHVLVTAVKVGAILGVIALLNMLVGFGATGAEEISGANFALIRTISGALVGALSGAYIAISLVVNLSKDKLTQPDHGGNLVSRFSLWSSENPKKVLAAFFLTTIVLVSGIPDIDTDVDATDVLPRQNPHTEAAKNISDEFKSSFTQQVTYQFTTNPDQCLRDSRENLPMRHVPDSATDDPLPDDLPPDEVPDPDNLTTPLLDDGSLATEDSSEAGDGPEMASRSASTHGGVNCGNITDEVYVRAVEEFYTFLKNYTYEEELDPFEEHPNEDEEGFDEDSEEAETVTVESPFEHQIGLPTFYKLVNWSVAGGQDDAPPSAVSLPAPDNRGRWHTVNETTWQTLGPDLQNILDGPEYDQVAQLYLVPADSNYTAREIGEFAIEARDAYLNWSGAEYQVFQEDENNPRFTVDLPVANAHGSELVEEDLELLMPLVAYLIVVSLYMAFRDLKSVLVAGSSLALAVLWTYGAMGLMDIALNPLNLLIVPLIMGSGIDYAIHMINEFQEHKSEGLSDAEAFLVAGKRAGLAMFLATVVTVAGLLVMVASPSLLMAQLGGLSAIAIASVYLLTVSFIPAVLTLMSGTDEMGGNFRPSTLIPKLGHMVSNHRVIFGILLVAATAAAAWGMTSLEEEEFGEPALNWPEDDPMRQEHEQGLAGFYNQQPGEPTFKANIVVVEGDITQYNTHQYIDSLHSNLTEQARDTGVVDMNTSNHLPGLIRGWLTIRNGTESVPQGIVSEELGNRGYEEQNQYPKNRRAIQRVLDNMFDAPISAFSSLFVNNPDYNISIMTVSVKTGSFDRAEQAWNAMSQAREDSESMKPDDVHTTFVGNTATNYLFVEEELPWLNIMSYVAFAVAILLVLAFTRSFKATLATGLIIGATSIWLLGVLPLVDIGLAITLMLPLVFVFNIGSDYAVHFIWNIQQVGDNRQVFSTVGKAVFFSALTDIGAFLLFTSWVPGMHGIRNLMAQEAMEATVIAIALIFVGTVAITALFYTVQAAEEDEAEEPTEAVEAPDGSPALPPGG